MGEIFMRQIINEMILNFKRYLVNEEKSTATVEKYVRDVEMFTAWSCGCDLEKSIVLEYKTKLCETHAPTSVNAALSSLNCFFAFCGWYDLNVKNLKIQRQIFASTEKELTKTEYERLLTAAKSKKNERLYLLMQTICSTGIRVSELKFITVEAVERGIAEINCKGKRRQVFLPKDLRKMLGRYIREQNRKKRSRVRDEELQSA